jgi:hypothetical protein
VRATTLLLFGLLPLAAAGCASDTVAERVGLDERLPDVAEGGRGAWLFWPRQMEVHPLTRVVAPTDGSPPTIDVRLEFRDANGNIVQATGTILVNLVAERDTPRQQRWRVSLNSLAEAARAYDSVTLTYRIVLAPEWTVPPAPGTPLQIEASFRGADGATLSARRTIAW